MRDDQAIIQTLKASGARFVIIGGHAVNVHGYHRNTEDVDVLWLRTPDSEIGIQKALESINACYIGRDIDPATGIERTYPVTLAHIRVNHLMMLCTDYGFLDLFDYVPGLPDQDVNAILDSALIVAGDPFISLEWLRRLKQASGRTKDQQDLENLLPPPDSK